MAPRTVAHTLVNIRFTSCDNYNHFHRLMLIFRSSIVHAKYQHRNEHYSSIQFTHCHCCSIPICCDCWIVRVCVCMCWMQAGVNRVNICTRSIVYFYTNEACLNNKKDQGTPLISHTFSPPCIDRLNSEWTKYRT